VRIESKSTSGGNVATWSASASSCVPSWVAGNGSNTSMLVEDSGVGARRLAADFREGAAGVVGGVGIARLARALRRGVAVASCRTTRRVPSEERVLRGEEES